MRVGALGYEVELWIVVPQRMTGGFPEILENSAAARASVYVAPPTMHTIMSVGLLTPVRISH